MEKENRAGGEQTREDHRGAGGGEIRGGGEMNRQDVGMVRRRGSVQRSDEAEMRQCVKT